MSPSNREGSRALAAYLRVLQDARRTGLPAELAAEEAWPFFQEAVAAALREGRALRRGARARWGGGVPLTLASGVDSRDSESRV